MRFHKLILQFSGERSLIAAYDSNDEEGWENFACTLVRGQGDNTKCNVLKDFEKNLWSTNVMYKLR